MLAMLQSGNSESPCSRRYGRECARIDAFVLTNQIPETGAIQQGTGTDHAIDREAALLQRDVRQNIHRIRSHKNDAVVIVFHDVLDNIVKYRRISLQ